MKNNRTGTNELGNGVKYTGGFNMRAQWHGPGELNLPDGTTYQGSFKNNSAYGQGALTLSDGTVIKGTFVDGKMPGTDLDLFKQNLSILSFNRCVLCTETSQ